jgi:hypothetical protein
MNGINGRLTCDRLQGGEVEDNTQNSPANFSRPFRGSSQRLDSAPSRMHSGSHDGVPLSNYPNTSAQELEELLTHGSPVVRSNEPDNEEQNQSCDDADDELSDQNRPSIAISYFTQTNMRDIAAQLVRLNLQVGLIESDPR